MNLELEGKVAIVTGASRGMGFAIAKRLAEEGAHVALCARDASALEKVADELAGITGRRPMVMSCKLLSESQVRAFIDKVIETYG